jgi:hypothetical protein
MKRRKKIHPVPVITSRWTAWATQLASRRARLPDAPRLPLPLHATLGRTLVLLYQRSAAFQTLLQPQLKLSISGSSAWNIGTTNVYAPQLVFLKSLTSFIQRSLTSITERDTQQAVARPAIFEFRRAMPAPFPQEVLPQVAMTLAIARTRAEQLSTTLQRHYSIRQEADLTEVSRRLTRRLQRVHEVSVIRPPMALRKETSPGAMPKHLPSEAMAEQGTFERRGSSQSVQAMAMPALNVEQLASQVLKQIDRRVIARRERMGQI